MKINIVVCDVCHLRSFEISRLSCGHDICTQSLLRNERGEIQCSRGCGSVYVKEILEAV